MQRIVFVKDEDVLDLHSTPRDYTHAVLLAALQSGLSFFGRVFFTPSFGGLSFKK